MQRLLRVLLVLALTVVWASAITIDFEALKDGDQAGNFYTRVSFTNALVQTEGISLSPLYPPASGKNVAFNDPDGTMIITLTDPVPYAAAQFTYSELLTLEALDDQGKSLGKAVSRFDRNLLDFGVQGSSPNEYIEFYSSGPLIKKVQIWTESKQSDTFAIDNFSTVPEPGSGALVIPAILLLLVLARRRLPAKLRYV